MARLDMLMGIGLMLVGALAYALPAEQDFFALLPSFAGIVIATSALAATTDDIAKKSAKYINALAGVFLLIYASLRIAPHSLALRENYTYFLADVDVLGLSTVYLYLSITGFLEAGGLLKQRAQELNTTLGNASE